MSFSAEIKNKIYDKIHIDGSLALLIRDFWENNTMEKEFIFDIKIDDAFLSSKRANFDDLKEKGIIMEGAQGDIDYSYRGVLNIGLQSLDDYYKSILFRKEEEQFAIDVQDEKTKEIIAKLLPDFGVEMKINLFDFLNTDKEREDYFQYCNPLLSLLRLEYDGIIDIYFIGRFDISSIGNEYRGECGFIVNRDMILSEREIPEEGEKWDGTEEFITELIKKARMKNQEINVGKEKNGSLLISIVTYHDNTVKMVDLKMKYPYAHIDTRTHKGRIQGYKIIEKKKLTKEVK